MHNLVRLRKARPEVNLLVTGGIYDITVPVGEVGNSLRHSELPSDQIQYVVYDSRNSVFAKGTVAFFAKVRELLHTSADK